MEDFKENIPLRCVFCKSTSFEIPYENYHPQPGEMLTCANCGRLNDYDSLMRVVTEKATNIAKEYAEKAIGDALKKAFKGSGFKLK